MNRPSACLRLAPRDGKASPGGDDALLAELRPIAGATVLAR